jgi:hypothetical protein
MLEASSDGGVEARQEEGQGGAEMQRWRREEESMKRGMTLGAAGRARAAGGSPQNIRGLCKKKEQVLNFLFSTLE